MFAMENSKRSPQVPENVFNEECELSAFMRRTMSASAVRKDENKFEDFCLDLIELPYDQRFPFAFDFFESIDGYPKIEHKPMKSSVEALRFKNLGNSAFGRGNLIDALKLYTKSVAVAPAGTPDLAVAYGNRSAALFELQRYEACMVDINRALNENCPEATKSKLLKRKLNCRSKVIELHAVEFGQNSLKKPSPRNKGSETKKDCPVDENAMDVDVTCPIDENAMDLDYSGKFPLPKTKVQNKNISGASEKIKITANSKFGRHIVAVKDIKIGEIIGVEKAYASVVFKECQFSHCANCFLRCEALIPCPKCSAVMYCSRRCREENLNRSHRIECQIFIYSHALGLPLPPSLRIAIQTMIVLTKQGENLEKLMNDPRFKNPMKDIPDRVPKKLDPENCVHHFLSLKIDTRLFAYPHDFILSEAALSLYRVITIGHILRHTTYYDAMIGKTGVDENLTKERKYVGLLFLKLMISLPTYTMGIEELLQKEVSQIGEHFDSYNTVGSGFYLFHSIFNHSCFTNAFGSDHKDTLVSQATQPIKAGQQVFITYGPCFLKTPRSDRRQILRSGYRFECSCEACENDWPMYHQMVANSLTLTPPSDTMCNLLREIGVKQVEYYTDEFEKFCKNPLRLIEYSTDSFNFFCKYLTIFRRTYKELVPDYYFAFFLFKTLLLSRGNNYVYTRDNVLMSL